MTSAKEFLSKRNASAPSAANFLSKRNAGRAAPTVAVTNPVDEPQGDVMRGRAQQVLQGAFYGLGDEATAGIVALLSRLSPRERRSIIEVYQDEVARERENMATNAKELGLGERIALQAGGGFLTGGALVKGAQAAGATAAAGALANPITGGAIEGGIAGFGASEADTLLGQAVDTAKGAGLGAVTAGAVTQTGRAFGSQFAEDVANTAKAVGKSVLERAKSIGVRLPPSAATGNAAAAMTEEALQNNPVTRGMFNKDIEHNVSAVGRTILRRFGIEGDRATGGVIEVIKRNINRKYDEIGESMAEALSLGPVDAQQADEMQSIFDEVVGSLADVKNPSRLREALERVQGMMQGTKDSKTIMANINWLRKRAAAAGRSGDEIIDAEALTQLEDLVTMAAMEADPRIALKLRDARALWRDLKAIDSPTVTNSATGKFNPVSLANRLNRSKFTRRVFGDAADQSEVLEVGRLVAQIEDAGSNPNLIFGIRSGSPTATRQGFSVGNLLGNTAAALPYATGRALGIENTTAAMTALRKISPRLAALQTGGNDR